MRVWILGSGTLRPDPRRGPPSYWVENGSASVLLDCGSGTCRTLAGLGLPWHAVTHLFLSHFHTDHVGGLAPYLFALKHGLDRPRSRELRIVGPPGLAGHLELLARAHGSYLLDPGFPVRVDELMPGTSFSDPSGNFRVKTRGTRHTETSLAFLMETPHGAFGYTGDTGPDPTLGSFFQDCALLVAECSHPDGWEGETHLTPASLARLAQAAGPELLVTVHAYPPLDPESIPDLLVGAGYTGDVLTGEDGLRIDFTDTGLVVVKPPGAV